MDYTDDLHIYFDSKKGDGYRNLPAQAAVKKLLRSLLTAKNAFE
jgi:hypothetical protein